MKMHIKIIGLVINPMAGIGGSVGLKGSDGEAIQKKALALGAVPMSVQRTIEALSSLVSIRDQIKFYTYPNQMGELALQSLGFHAQVIGMIDPTHTTALDTRKAAQDFAQNDVELIVFSGGDGTARDIYDAVGQSIPTLGIPTGVKIHSSVYAINPLAAGKILAAYIQDDHSVEMRDAEVMDLDEEALRSDLVATRLYGYLKILYLNQFMQVAKVPTHSNEMSAMREIAAYIIEQMQDGVLYIVGPGTTTQSIVQLLGLKKTLLGVDVLFNRDLLAKDVSEKRLLELLEIYPKRKIIVTPIGGQGFLFGRGNQQISERVQQIVGRENLLVVSTIDKITSLGGKPLLIDSGNTDVDDMFRGYVKVIVGYQRYLVYRIA